MKNLFLFITLFLMGFTFAQEITYVNNLSSLSAINFADISPNQVIYVNGYSSSEDGGGGLFRFDFNSSEDNYYGMYIKPDGHTGIGRWVRIYDILNVKYFGAKSEAASDDTQAIQNAIDFAQNAIETPKDYDHTQVYIPSGTYRVGKLILRDGTRIKGAGKSTQIIPIENPNSDLIVIDKGIVTNVEIENILFNGQNKNITCFFFEAQKEDNCNSGCKGGLWRSAFNNISIQNFGGHGIFLKGDNPTDFPESTFDFPNQHITFKQVNINRKQNPGYNALKITGQTGQINFLECVLGGSEISPSNPPTSWNVYIDHSPRSKGSLAIIRFDTCSISKAIGGLYIVDSENIIIDGCWFENLDTAIKVENSQMIDITRNRFANASDYGFVNPAYEDGNTDGFILRVVDDPNDIFMTTVKFTENFIWKHANTTVQDSSSYLYKRNNLYRNNGVEILEDTN